MNLIATKRKNLEKMVCENISGLHEYIGKQGGYKFVKNMDKELFEQQLIQWINNLRSYRKKFKSFQSNLINILGEYVKIENLKDKYNIQ